jgi:hypothetical protein
MENEKEPHVVQNFHLISFSQELEIRSFMEILNRLEFNQESFDLLKDTCQMLKRQSAALYTLNKTI